MILLTRLNGQPFALNPDLLQRAEATPDTVLTLVDGTKLVVSDSVESVLESVRDYRASVVARAQDMWHEPPAPLALAPVADPATEAKPVSLHGRRGR